MEGLRGLTFYRYFLFKDLGNQSNELLSDTSLEKLSGIDLDDAEEVTFHVENTLSKNRYFVCMVC
mgnify:CR=1 FL=1